MSVRPSEGKKGTFFFFVAVCCLLDLLLWQDGDMPRTARASTGGIGYHVLNRGNARQDVSHDDDDRRRFIELIQDACARVPHGPGIHAAPPRTPTNRGKKVECPLFPSVS